MAWNGDGYLAIFRSETSTQTRLLGQRLDAAGNPIDGEPFVIESAGALGSISLAWNGSEYLAVWTSVAGQIVGKRILPDGTVLDSTPLSFVTGAHPDVAALGDTFLLAYTHTQFGEHNRYMFTVRIGADGAVQGTPISHNFPYATWPRVKEIGGRWLVVWERNISHDDFKSWTSA
jgi:hypothetical protein